MFEYLQCFQGVIACDGAGNVRVIPSNNHYIFNTLKAEDCNGDPVMFNSSFFLNANCLDQTEDDVELAVIKQEKEQTTEEAWFIKYDN